MSSENVSIPVRPLIVTDPRCGRPLIVVDMDGVLVDFCRAAYETHGRVQGVDEPNEFDFFKQWGLTTDQFWSPIDAQGPDWWSDLPLFPWAVELLALVKSYGELVIATASSTNQASAAGKVVALQNLFGPRFRDYFITPCKWLLGRPGRILIDDNDENCEKFQAYGGRSILFPQPWNKNRSLAGCDRLDYVVNMLAATV